MHLLSDDLRMLLAFVQSRSPVMITLKQSDTADVRPVEDPLKERRVMALWNRNISPSLERKRVARTGHDYYRIDDSQPTLELSPSRLVEWGGKSALLQGRIYGFFVEPNTQYAKWYDSTAHWIRAHFARNPVKPLGGYVGPEALQWHQGGGILMPMLHPPMTPEWLSLVAEQHQT